MKIIFCLLSAFNFLSADTTSNDTSQGVLNKIQDLPDITVHSSKLTAVNIIDSILFYEKENYFYPEAYTGKITGVLNKGVDSSFYAITDSVYFVRKNRKRKVEYVPKIARQNTTDFIKDQLDSFSRKRVMTWTGFPPLKDFQSVIGGTKKTAAASRTLFGVSRQDSVLIHHILIRSRPTNKGSANSSFLHLTIDRKGWKLMSMELYLFDSTERFLASLNEAQSCSAALQALDSGIYDPQIRCLKFTLCYKTARNQKLIPSELKFQDNLLNLAFSLFKKAEDKSGAMYTYDLRFDDFVDELPAVDLKEFRSSDWAYRSKAAAW
jgi:hypothetical protein